MVHMNAISSITVFSLRYRYQLLCLTSLFFFLPSIAFSQSFGIDNGGYLKLTPTYPIPNSTVEVSLELYSVNTSGASIRWFIDGVENTTVQNNRQIQLPTGSFGSKTRIQAVVTPQNGSPVTVENTLMPSEIDLIVEGNTLTPAFYKGRALPAGDEIVAVIAIPHIPGYTNSSSLTYTWTLGNTVLFGGPVAGKMRAEFTMPKSQKYLSVTVANSQGTILGGNTILLKPVRPELYFYEDNPLRGLNERALVGTFSLLGDEATVRAEPYFTSKNIFTANSEARWTVNGRLADYGDDVRTITLRKEGGSGEARVDFSLMSRESFLQSVTESFSIRFE